MKVDGRTLYLQAFHERLEQGPSATNWSKSRQAIAAHLQAYIEERVQQVDREIAAALLVALEQAEAKEVPELFTPLPRVRGESADTAAVKACIAAAGSYILFCQYFHGAPGVDIAPVTTVVREYGISKRQAQRWKARGNLPPDLGASAFHLDDDEPAHFVSLGIEHFRRVRAGMRAGAKQYVRLGGSGQQAIRRRNAKRRE